MSDADAVPANSVRVIRFKVSPYDARDESNDRQKVCRVDSSDVSNYRRHHGTPKLIRW